MLPSKIRPKISFRISLVHTKMDVNLHLYSKISCPSQSHVATSKSILCHWWKPPLLNWERFDKGIAIAGKLIITRKKCYETLNPTMLFPAFTESCCLPAQHGWMVPTIVTSERCIMKKGPSNFIGLETNLQSLKYILFLILLVGLSKTFCHLGQELCQARMLLCNECSDGLLRDFFNCCLSQECLLFRFQCKTGRLKLNF